MHAVAANVHHSPRNIRSVVTVMLLGSCGCRYKQSDVQEKQAQDSHRDIPPPGTILGACLRLGTEPRIGTLLKAILAHQSNLSVESSWSAPFSRLHCP